MAATPYESTPFAPANAFDIYNDAPPTTPRNLTSLPGGGCNFADLTPGANGVKCGCRRFWARQLPGGPPDQSGWCMCNHHACYHDQGPQELQSPFTQTAGQENERPRTGREPLSPMLGMSYGMPSTTPGIDFPGISGEPLSFIHEALDQHDRISRADPTQPPGSLPDTMPWTDRLHSPAHPISPLPPIPSQCLMPSQTTSTASSVQARYIRPFAGKGLRTLSGTTNVKPPGSSHQHKNAYHDANGPDASFVLVQPDDQRTTSRPATATLSEHRSAHALAAVNTEALKEWVNNTLGDHSQRLGRLETVSFHDECHDRFDNFDVRMSEFESRLEEVEKATNDNASVATAHGARHDECANQSIISTSTCNGRAQRQSDVMIQIQSLQSQVSVLHSYLPSPQYAWVVEVVFLPFPVKRLWQRMDQFRSDPVIESDDWTQVPMTLSTASRRSLSPCHNDWATPDSVGKWLLPRACSNTSITDKRLRSRGLIKTITVKSPDFRSVQSAMQAAFGNVFREMQLHPRPDPHDVRSAKFLGLHQGWVPLRKVHKDSRLRFLSPAEMMIPGLWGVPFLSSVMMRSSEPRLFITHPDAYLQDSLAYELGWSWQRLRELTRVYPDVTESTEVPEADALEEHWAWCEALDEAPSTQASSIIRQDRRRSSLSPLVAIAPSIRSMRRSESPVVTRAQSPLAGRKNSSVATLYRRVSAPMSAPMRSSPPVSRPFFSSQMERSSPVVRSISQARVCKKRRRQSSSHQQATPRLTASPSIRLTSPVDRHSARGTTPLAYATPHSNAPLQEMRRLRESSVALTHMPEQEYEFPDMKSFESESDESYMNGNKDDDDDDDEDDSSEDEDMFAGLTEHAQPEQGQRPEDQPWLGLEDRNHISDGENNDLRDWDGATSVSSSQPSEYTSKSQWPADGADTIRIHEDHD